MSRRKQSQSRVTTRKSKPQPGSNAALYEVVTIQEACQIAHVAIGTIRYHIDKGHLEFRKTNQAYLISLQSLASLYPHVEIKTAIEYLRRA